MDTILILEQHELLILEPKCFLNDIETSMKLRDKLSEEEILLASIEGDEFMKKIKENEHEH